VRKTGVCIPVPTRFSASIALIAGRPSSVKPGTDRARCVTSTLRHRDLRRKTIMLRSLRLGVRVPPGAPIHQGQDCAAFTAHSLGLSRFTVSGRGALPSHPPGTRRDTTGHSRAEISQEFGTRESLGWQWPRVRPGRRSRVETAQLARKSPMDGPLRPGPARTKGTVIRPELARGRPGGAHRLPPK
jgi:hypothetical protein